MPGYEEIRTTTQWRTESRFYRRPSGLGWLLALLAVPLLLGAIGYGIRDRDADVDVTMPSVDASVTLTAPTVTAPNVNVPSLSFAPLSIARNGNDFTLSGELHQPSGEDIVARFLEGRARGRHQSDRQHQHQAGYQRTRLLRYRRPFSRRRWTFPISISI